MKNILTSLGMTITVMALCASAFAQSTPAPTLDDLSKYDSADKLWTYIEELQGRPAKAATPEEKRKLVAEAIANLDVASKEFTKRYPQDPRRWDIQLTTLQVDKIKPSLGLPSRSAEDTAKELSDIANAKDASEKTREMASAALVLAAQKDISEDAFDAKIAEFETQFPDSRQAAQLRKLQLQKLRDKDPAKADALLKKLSSNNNKAVAQFAADQLALADMLKKPLDLKFTAVDGSEVDLAKLRGKVVLLDFWATWCGPCVAEVPHVVETYKELHDKAPIFRWQGMEKRHQFQVFHPFHSRHVVVGQKRDGGQHNRTPEPG